MTRKSMAIDANAVLKKKNPTNKPTYMIGHKRKGMVTCFCPLLNIK